jgi:hypothetical protein
MGGLVKAAGKLVSGIFGGGEKSSPPPAPPPVITPPPPTREEALPEPKKPRQRTILTQGTGGSGGDTGAQRKTLLGS